MNYKKAPDILTGKDLDYLKDMFGWNHTAYKLMEDALEFVEDKKVKEMISNNSNLFYNNLESIIKILKDGKNEQ